MGCGVETKTVFMDQKISTAGIIVFSTVFNNTCAVNSLLVCICDVTVSAKVFESHWISVS